MSAQTSYQRVLALDDEDEDEDEEVVNANGGLDTTEYRDDDSGAESGTNLRLVDPAYRQRASKRRIFLCACRQLSATCIAVSALVALAITSLLGAGGYWAYKTGMIDGQSPPYYPTPRGGTAPSWAESYRKAQRLVAEMTLPEKVNITTGTGWAMDLCVGNTGAVPRVGFPAMCLQDGPLGIRFADHSTSFPAGITVGATWNRDLMRRRGEQHGREASAKGIHVLLGPAMGPLGRNPAGGRNWEGFGSDPVLQAVAAAETIKGIQSQGVQATAKHFIGNEQEHFRKSFEWGLPEALSSNIDDRTLHEIYAWPFAEAIRAGVASVMCSYQMVNNSYACQNSLLLNGILKDELGFQGYVQSDWLAQRSGVASALAGLDMSMPGDGLYWMNGHPLFGEELTVAALNTSVPMDRLNDMVARIVAAWYQLGQDARDDEGPNFSSWTNESIGKWHDSATDSKATGQVNKFVKVSNKESVSIARQVAAEGTILLKNEDNILPLTENLAAFAKSPKTNVMVIGEDAGPGKGPNACKDRGCNQGTLAVGWGSGATEFEYLIDPFTALSQSFDSSVVDLSAALVNQPSSKIQKQLKTQDLCLAFANADAGEGYLAWNGVKADRNDLDLQKDGTSLLRTVADLCGGPVIVVIHSVGPVIMEDFADHPNVKAIVLANLPGQESGNALADVLFGRIDASGRLPYTVGRSMAEYGKGAPVLYYPNHMVPQVDFNEGLYIDYRHFDKNGIEPRFAFGFGLSYTTFEYSDLNITILKGKSSLPESRPQGIAPPVFDTRIPDPSTAVVPATFNRLRKYIYPWITSVSQVKKGAYPYPKGYDTLQQPSQAGGGEGGNPSLFDPHVAVGFTIKNSGLRKGMEVPQLYVSFPPDVREPSTGQVIDTPIQMLRNFTKVELESGESTTVTMLLTRKDLSYWSVVHQNWIMPEQGEFRLAVGQSSRGIRLRGTY